MQWPANCDQAQKMCPATLSAQGAKLEPASNAQRAVLSERHLGAVPTGQCTSHMKYFLIIKILKYLWKLWIIFISDSELTLVLCIFWGHYFYLEKKNIMCYIFTEIYIIFMPHSSIFEILLRRIIGCDTFFNVVDESETTYLTVSISLVDRNFRDFKWSSLPTCRISLTTPFS